jgi:hypothetical protein
VRNALISSRLRVETNTLPATTSPTDKRVLQGVADLFLFAAPQKGCEDKKRQSQLYLEALAPFDPEIREATIDSLRFDNPRNPYQPSHQDVRERCEKISKLWLSAVGGYFVSSSEDPYWPSALGGAHPLSDECVIPMRWVKRYLSSWLERCATSQMENLEQLDRRQIDRIPHECFPDGLRAKLIARIEIREAERAERQRMEDYLFSMDPELREHRSEVLRWNSRGGETKLSEEQIIELAKESMERERQRIASLEGLRGSDPLLVEWAEKSARENTRGWDRKKHSEQALIILREVDSAALIGAESEFRRRAATHRILRRMGHAAWVRTDKDEQEALVTEELSKAPPTIQDQGVIQ